VVALSEVNKLKYNPRISLSKITELPEEYIYTAFAKLRDEEITIADIVSSMDLTTRFKRTVDAYESNFSVDSHYLPANLNTRSLCIF
jgi:hypothetical protein